MKSELYTRDNILWKYFRSIKPPFRLYIVRVCHIVSIDYI